MQIKYIVLMLPPHQTMRTIDTLFDVLKVFHGPTLSSVRQSPVTVPAANLRLVG